MKTASLNEEPYKKSIPKTIKMFSGSFFESLLLYESKSVFTTEQKLIIKQLLFSSNI